MEQHRSTHLHAEETMRRTSKFSFPIPGRKHKEDSQGRPAHGANNLSKAQRILGTDNDLNIDTLLARDEDRPWTPAESRSSGMSISISETTASSNHDPVHWEGDVDMSPTGLILGEQASSNLLGRRFMEDGRFLRDRDSSSTLKSYYDRQNIPLSISQQTSASSSRDMALRKGYPPAISNGPSTYDLPHGSSDSHGATGNEQKKEDSFDVDEAPATRKKISRLDLSTLFSKARKPGHGPTDSSSLSPIPSTAGTEGSRLRSGHLLDPTRRKLKRSQSKDSMHSPRLDVLPERSQSAMAHIYDHGEDLPFKSPRMYQIPETRVVHRPSTSAGRLDHFTTSLNHAEPMSSSPEKGWSSWRNVRAFAAHHPTTEFHTHDLTPSLVPRTWGSASTASISSRNTRTSKNTAGSVISQSDLHEKSVLSLSSDSEGDSDAQLPVENDIIRIGTIMDPLPPPQTETRISPPRSETPTARRGHRTDASLEAPISTVPEDSVISNDLSGPLIPSSSLITPPSSSHRHMKRPGTKSSDRNLSFKLAKSPQFHKPLSNPSAQSSQILTPPHSPGSAVFRQPADKTCRMMAVTEQEEALLAALRRKRARMREQIIEEHENAARNHSAKSSVSTIPRSGTVTKKQEVLLFFDAPISASRSMDIAEPSPDLSDFCFASDDESTPKTSRAPSRMGRSRRDSHTVPYTRDERLRPLTPSFGLPPDRHAGLASPRKEKRSIGVRFIDEEMIAGGEHFILEDDEPMIWNMPM